MKPKSPDRLHGHGIFWLLFFFGLVFSFPAYSQLQSVTLTADRDLNITYPSHATANATELTTKVTTTSGSYTRFILQFPISIPANAVIVSAQLRLTPKTTELTTGIRLQRVTSPFWSESTTNLDPVLTGVIAPESALASGKRVFNVKPFVESIVNTGTANYGWVVRCEPETTVTGGNSYYTRSETLASSRRPTLVVQYYIPYSIPDAVFDHCSSPGATDGSITPSITDGSGNPTNYYEWKDSTGTTIASGTGASTLTGVGKGCYYMKVSGAYDALYMAFIVGVDCEVFTTTFAPGPFYVDDANITDNILGNSGSSLLNFAGRTVTFSIYNTARTFMRYRLWMDPDLVPMEAKLKLSGTGSHVYSGGSNEAKLVQITQDWGEYCVEVTNAPTVSTAISATLPATTSVGQNQIIETKDFWNYWKADNTLNYGMCLQPFSTVNYVMRQQFHSSDAASNRPTIQFRIDDGTCDRTSYVKFKKTLDGSFAMTFQGRLKISFSEEYKQDPNKIIPLKLYDDNNIAIAGVDGYGVNIPGLTAMIDLPYAFDDNRYVLDLNYLSLTAGKFYVLELTLSTGEKEYIKFQFTN